MFAVHTFVMLLVFVLAEIIVQNKYVRPRTTYFQRYVIVVVAMLLTVVLLNHFYPYPHQPPISAEPAGVL